MAEEKAPASASELEQTLDPNQTSIEATESTCNNNNAAESETTLEFADELTEKGSVFLKESDFAEAVDCFSRALEIRVEHFGELASECVKAYYKYGSALLEKAQAEADPLGINMPKKEAEAQQESTPNGESVAASVLSSDPEKQGSSSGGQGGSDGKEDGEDCQDDDISDADADEDESDLDMAWKMLDIARAITDKHSTDTMEKVDILCALAEISLEREDIESSLSDYKKALSILERLVEPDSRHIAELNFRICICLETGCQTKEAIPYCQKAVLICKARMERLSNEVKCPSGSATSSTVSENEAEIRTLSGLAEDLEKKLEDLRQQADNPKQLLAELMGMASAKAVATAAGEMSSSQMGTANIGKDLESPTVSTAQTGSGGGASGVTHLGVVGRGVKRVLLNAESSPSKKQAPESSDKADV
ncbi:nuclear autoantigenic sperm protein [Brassica rapa]|uniref:nuclear autoantigenic sperm protein n=1 Tax=Brassica campestris TaxID=3711 RepID=UPI0004F159BD|nr:nuclear autoantigenic sperm protein [Brassica rapa]